MCSVDAPEPVEIEKPTFVRNPYLDDASADSRKADALRRGRSSLVIPTDATFNGRGGSTNAGTGGNPNGNGRGPRGGAGVGTYQNAGTGSSGRTPSSGRHGGSNNNVATIQR